MVFLNGNETVRIYKLYCFDSPDPDQIGESCSLLPWCGDRPGLRGQDDGGTEYELPQGYSVKTDEYGEPALFCGHTPCGLTLHNGRPILVDSSKQQAVLLDPVKKILRMRERAGLSRGELAELLGVSVKELFEWENREKDPSEDLLARVAELLRCNLSDLI